MTETHSFMCFKDKFGNLRLFHGRGPKNNVCAKASDKVNRTLSTALSETVERFKFNSTLQIDTSVGKVISW